METMTPGRKSGSKIARRNAARLFAAQAVYQMIANEESAESVARDFLARRVDERRREENLVPPDEALFSMVVRGVGDRRPDLDRIVSGARTNEKTLKDDLLLQSILLCGAFELLANNETDAFVIISSYVYVAHAFFDQNEPKLVNAMLDRIARNVRDAG